MMSYNTIVSVMFQKPYLVYNHNVVEILQPSSGYGVQRENGCYISRDHVTAHDSPLFHAVVSGYLTLSMTYVGEGKIGQIPGNKQSNMGFSCKWAFPIRVMTVLSGTEATPVIPRLYL